MTRRATLSKFIHKITFLENTNRSEIEEGTWNEVQTSFAEIHPVCDNRFIALEGISFGNVITEGYFFFRTRFIKKIHREMRIKFHDRIFEIKRLVDEEERGKMLSIVALEIFGDEDEANEE